MSILTVTLPDGSRIPVDVEDGESLTKDEKKALAQHVEQTRHPSKERHAARKGRK